ncbi:phosphoenolpyruvate--protein phosphotransferase [Halanaerobacter jeridensis]|uniref:Phosphoenolpyruvate-protein phosphotransferase n=1 Tax=Halanaerobacter jeridensis TaxID=706427 RepID=A0A938XPP0_9FIRM|nr:phosphoenolpyruvate--protein phosphotransferase [Halanaerobacter jeridensis]MBM7556902.1 phosphotransferase system enzyme I (PtsI) [Halanaerobacter jeridensis]
MSQELTGVAASPGVASAEVLVLEGEVEYEERTIEDTAGEKKRLKDAIAKSKKQLEKIKAKVKREIGDQKAQIFAAHLKAVEDPELIKAVETKIDQEQINAEAGVDQAIEEFASRLEALDNEYMQERAGDFRDVGSRILKNLLGLNTVSLAELDKEVILVARDLAPSDTAQIDKELVQGFATAVGSRTSHTAIMARSMEIPAVVGATGILDDIETGDQMIVDGLDGTVIVNPSDAELAEYEEKAEEYAQRKKRLAELKELPAETTDGHQVELVANIGTPADIPGAQDNGAEGIGLYRSEFLYMDRDSLPTEEEQFEAYKEVAEKIDGPIVIRTMDIGGDKELPYLDMPEEMNPFLGYRAIRMCLDKPEIFKVQLRAILRASAYGQVKIMYPMISAVEQLREANQILAEVKEELREENIAFDEDLEVGMMIEVPAAAMVADILAKEADFFSIGTNDLIQYTTATDRMNEQIADLYQPFHPALLRMIKRVVDAAHEEGKWAGMCGEMAGDKRLAPFLLGVGLDEFSMSAVSIPEVKDQIRNMSLEEAEELAEEALSCETAQEVREVLSN